VAARFAVAGGVEALRKLNGCKLGADAMIAGGQAVTIPCPGAEAKGVGGC
jgi:hypothetical protein